MYLQPNLIIKQRFANIIRRTAVCKSYRVCDTHIITSIIPSAASTCLWKSSSGRSIVRVDLIFQIRIRARHLFNQAIANCAKINQHAACYKSNFVADPKIIQISRKSNHITPDKSQAPCHDEKIGKVIYFLPCHLFGSKKSITNKIRFTLFLKTKKPPIPKQRRKYLGQDGCKWITCEKQNSNSRYDTEIAAFNSIKSRPFKRGHYCRHLCNPFFLYSSSRFLMCLTFFK